VAGLGGAGRRRPAPGVLLRGTTSVGGVRGGPGKSAGCWDGGDAEGSGGDSRDGGRGALSGSCAGRTLLTTGGAGRGELMLNPINPDTSLRLRLWPRWPSALANKCSCAAAEDKAASPEVDAVAGAAVMVPVL